MNHREYTQRVMSELFRHNYSDIVQKVEILTNTSGDLLQEDTVNIIYKGFLENVPPEEVAVAIYSAAFLAFHEVFGNVIRH